MVTKLGFIDTMMEEIVNDHSGNRQIFEDQRKQGE